MATSAGTVLAVGAAGEMAGLVLPELVARGATVRAMVQRDDQVANVRSRGANQVVVADLRDSDSVSAALDGVDRAFYIAPAFIDDEAAIGERFVQLAVSAGVQRIVFSSVVHPVLSGLINHAAKAPVEEAILNSGLGYTFLHPTLFFQMLRRSFDGVVASGVLAEPWSAETRFSRVDYRDVAEVAAMAICEDNLLYGTFELASPGWTNRHDVAALIAHAVGRPIAARRVDPLALKNVSGPMRTMFEHYDHHGLLANPLTLEAILGHPARLLSTYLSELAEGNASRPQRASKPLPPKRLSGAAIND